MMLPDFGHVSRYMNGVEMMLLSFIHGVKKMLLKCINVVEVNLFVHVDCV